MRGREVERPPQEGEHTHEPPLDALPPEGPAQPRGAATKLKRKRKRAPTEGEHEPCWPSREPSREDDLPTWQGSGPCDPGGSRRGCTPSSRKGLLRPWTSHRASSPLTRNLAAPEQVRSGTHIHKTTTHLFPTHHHSDPSPRAPAIEELIRFHFEAHREGTTSSLEARKALKRATRHRNAAVWWPSRPIHKFRSSSPVVGDI